MAPMLRDDGPPVSPATIDEARRTLPSEYGHVVVEESGRRVLLVRVPAVKPDYLTALREVALYVDLETVRDVKDVLLIGSGKVTRLEPIALRDHIREQRTVDQGVAEDLRGPLSRDYGHRVVDAENGKGRAAIAVRIPRASLADITADDVIILRDRLRPLLADRLRDLDCAYVISDSDFERLGRRVFLELVDPDRAASHDRVEPKEALKNAAMAASGNEAYEEPEAPATIEEAFPELAEESEYELTTTPRASAAAPASGSAAAAGDARDPAPERTHASTVVDDANQYEIFTRTKPRAPEPEPEPVAVPAAQDEYEILTSSRPAPAEPVADSPAPAANAPAPGLDPDDEYEILGAAPRTPQPRAPAPRAPETRDHVAPEPRQAASRTPVTRSRTTEPVGPKSPVMRDHPPIVPGFVQTLQDDDIEVYVRKEQEAPRDIGPTPAAPRSAHHATAPAVEVEDQFEAVAGGRVTPQQTTPQGPIGDNGGDVEMNVGDEKAVDQLMREEAASDREERRIPSLAPQPPGGPDFDVLATRLEGLGYEIVRDVPVEDNIFDIAAHKNGGKRLLAMNVESFAAAEGGAYDKLAVNLGADVLLVVTNNLAPGARLATWGTRVQVFRPDELIEVGL